MSDKIFNDIKKAHNICFHENQESASLSAKRDYGNVLAGIGEILLSAEYTEIVKAQEIVSEIIGNLFEASNVMIYKYASTKLPREAGIISEWERNKNSVGGHENSGFVAFPKSWKKHPAKGTIICKRLAEADIEETVFFHANDAKTLMLVPIIINNEIWGSVQMLFATGDRKLTKTDQRMIIHTSGLLASSIRRNTAVGHFEKTIKINQSIRDSNPFNCVMFDKNAEILYYNVNSEQFFGLIDSQNIKQSFLDALEKMRVKKMPDGSQAVLFLDRLKEAFREGDCEYETSMIVDEKNRYFNVILKRIEYEKKDVVIGYMFDITTQKDVQLELKRHNNLLVAMGNVADMLLTADALNIDNTIQKSLDLIGRAAFVDRINIWKNFEAENGQIYATKMQEWTIDDSIPPADLEGENIVYDERFPSWRETLEKGYSVSVCAKDVVEGERIKVIDTHVVSLLVVPIIINDQFWGFIGFDDCHEEHIFSTVEKNVFRICGFMAMVISDNLGNEMAKNLLAEREAALTNAKTKSSFLANMSHEIRTPMNAILGMSELIVHEKTSETVMSHAIDIRNACRGLLVLINDILDISKIESGKLEIVPDTYPLSSLLMDVISIIKVRAENKGISFVVNIDPHIPGQLVGDEIRLKQILINILNNAVKFTHEGQVVLSVTGETKNNACKLKFAIEDTGIGIKEEDMGKIFVLFQQVDSRKNRNVEGTGLGLSISKQLAEMMNGSITVESKYEVGTKVTVEIEQIIKNALPVATLRDEEKTVLIYENRTLILESLTNSLTSLGCKYTICSNQSEMFRYLDQYKYDFIFVSYLHFNKTYKVATAKRLQAKLIILRGDDASFRSRTGLIISMPIYSLQLANILNNEYEESTSRLEGTHTANFIAPEAKVLVVDDNAVNLKVAVGLLKLFGINPDTASNGRSAVKMVKEEDYDLVFMDHMMPEMDGIDTTIAIRNIGMQYASLPIIALSANAVGGVEEMFLAEGLSGFLPKPVEMVKLSKILKEWLPPKKLIEIKHDIVTKEIDLGIAGLNSRKGIRNTGGQAEEYDEILQIYVADCEEKLLEIAQNHRSENWSSFSTNAHSLQGASANIGAEEISRMAENLETASRSGDVEYIDSNLWKFTDALSFLIENIKGYLSGAAKSEVLREKKADMEYLKEVQHQIGMCFKDLDVNGIESALIDINAYRWNDEIITQISKIEEGISNFDYEGLGEAIKEFCAFGDGEAKDKKRRFKKTPILDKPSVMIVDDNVVNLQLARKALRDAYTIIPVTSGEDALLLLTKKIPALILLDIDMPDMDGFEVLRIIKAKEETQNIPVIFLTAMNDNISELEGLKLGAMDYITKPFSIPLLIQRIDIVLKLIEQRKELEKYNNNLIDMVDEKTETIEELQHAIIHALGDLIECRDGLTGGHVNRTQKYLQVLLDACVESGTFEEEMKTADKDLWVESASLHDIGKVGIPDEILKKPGRLTAEEFEVIKTHPLIGEKAIKGAMAKTREKAFLRQASIIAVTHHEKWDGTGYPYGLKGKKIPLVGRLMAIADVYDALVSERPYKKGFSHEKATDIIVSEAGKQFDPALIEVYMSCEKLFRNAV